MKRKIRIRNGTIIDGTGSLPFHGDVLVDGGRIRDVGSSEADDDADAIDASGLIVAPGFIDIHSHSDVTLLVDPRAASSITQGVTLELVGNCGYGCAFVGDPRIAKEFIYGYKPEIELSWRSTAGYLEQLDRVRPAVNVATLVPNGQLRLATIGMEGRPARPDELKEMEALLTRCLEEGAFGLSTGLESGPEAEAPEEEVTAMSRLAARAGGLYATHTRNRDDRAVEAIEEAIRTAERAGARLQISHLTPRGGPADAERAMTRVDEALKRGVEVSFDMHTRLFGTTYLKTVLPHWVLKGGKRDIVRRLKDPAVRTRLKAFRNLMTSLGDWERVVLLDNPSFPEFSRRNFAEIAGEMGAHPLDCAYDILMAEVDALHRPMVILHAYTEDLLRMTYEHPGCMIGSDATALAPDGPLRDSVFHGAYTWASWFYRRMVREARAFTPEAGIFKITGQPAQTLGLTDRGVIRKGAHADLAIFDPDRFGETGSTFEPNQIAEGMAHVLVNGEPTLRDGQLTGTRAGEVIRR